VCNFLSTGGFKPRLGCARLPRPHYCMGVCWSLGSRPVELLVVDQRQNNWRLTSLAPPHLRQRAISRVQSRKARIHRIVAKPGVPPFLHAVNPEKTKSRYRSPIGGWPTFGVLDFAGAPPSVREGGAFRLSACPLLPLSRCFRVVLLPRSHCPRQKIKLACVGPPTVRTTKPSVAPCVGPPTARGRNRLSPGAYRRAPFTG
jgi:hypothetical protein